MTPTDVDDGTPLATVTFREIAGARFGADLFDVWFVPLTLGSIGQVLVGGPPGALLGSALVVAVLVVLEGTTGQTPGKAVRRLRTVRLDGSVPGLRAAFVRRSWMLLLPVLAGTSGFADPVVGVAVLLYSVGVVWIVATMQRDPAGRGVHDRLAGTVVVPARPEQVLPFRDLTLIFVTFLLLGVVGAVLRQDDPRDPFGPDVVPWPAAEASCTADHREDGERWTETFALRDGSTARVEVGAFDVTLELVTTEAARTRADEQELRGLSAFDLQETRAPFVLLHPSASVRQSSDGSVAEAELRYGDGSEGRLTITCVTP